jgi:hypothetical protein
MAISISILALVLGLIAASPAIKRWYDLYTLPRKAARIHEWILLLETGQITILFSGGPNSPTARSILIQLWYEYRRICKHRIETDPEIFNETLRRFQQEHRKYVTTAELEPSNLTGEETRERKTPEEDFDYYFARRFGLEYSSTATDQVLHPHRVEAGGENPTPQEQDSIKLERARTALQQWIRANREKDTTVIVEEAPAPRDTRQED